MNAMLSKSGWVAAMALAGAVFVCGFVRVAKNGGRLAMDR